MKVSTKGRYALRLMLDLASQPEGEYISLRDISLRQGISMKYLEQIVSLLCRAGFIKSLRGPKGGYRLARKPREYTAGQILRVTEGDLSPTACLQDEVNLCPRAVDCGTLNFWTGFFQVINEYVDSVTLADLL